MRIGHVLVMFPENSTSLERISIITKREKLLMLKKVSMSRESLDKIRKDNKSKKANMNKRNKSTNHENK